MTGETLQSGVTDTTRDLMCVCVMLEAWPAG